MDIVEYGGLICVSLVGLAVVALIIAATILLVSELTREQSHRGERPSFVGVSLNSHKRGSIDRKRLVNVLGRVDSQGIDQVVEHFGVVYDRVELF